MAITAMPVLFEYSNDGIGIFAYYTNWIFIWHSNPTLRLVSSPTENLVVGEDADHTGGREVMMPNICLNGIIGNTKTLF